MNITPATNNTIPTTRYTTPDSTPVKPLTNELDEPVRFSLSGEGIFISELAARAPEGQKPPKISQASIKMLEFDVKLMQQMKTQRLAGQSTGNNVEDLAIAYDNLQKSLNENSENSQKHVKFLDDAFNDISRLFFTQEAKQQHRNSIDFEDETQNPNINEDAATRLKQVIADAEKKSNLFADSFLKNYKKHGLDAFNIAIASLQGL